MARLSQKEKEIVNKMLQGHEIANWYLEKNLSKIKRALSYKKGYNLLKNQPRIVLNRDYSDLYIKDNPLDMFKILINAWYYNKFISKNKTNAKRYLEHAEELNNFNQLHQKIDNWEKILNFKWNAQGWEMDFEKIDIKNLKDISIDIMNEISAYPKSQTFRLLNFLKKKEIPLKKYQNQIKEITFKELERVDEEFKYKINNIEGEIIKSDDKLSYFKNLLNKLDKDLDKEFNKNKKLKETLTNLIIEYRNKKEELKEFINL